MSRIIKFRAWSETWGKYSKPFTLKCDVINFTNDNGLGVIKSLGDEIVEQFTGLKDKNGVEIYEGDICADHNQYNPQDLIIIEWRKAGFTGRYNNCGSYVSYVPVLADKVHIEVIGNVHQHKELLK